MKDLHKRMIDHLKSLGKIPADFDPNKGGYIGKGYDEDDDSPWDGALNTSGEPHTGDDMEEDRSMEFMGHGGVRGYSEGGEVSAWDNIMSNLTTGQSKEKKGWAHGGVIDGEKEPLDPKEIHRAMAQAIMRRRR